MSTKDKEAVTSAWDMSDDEELASFKLHLYN